MQAKPMAAKTGSSRLFRRAKFDKFKAIVVQRVFEKAVFPFAYIVDSKRLKRQFTPE